MAIPVTFSGGLSSRFLARKVLQPSCGHLVIAGGVTKTNQNRWPGSRKTLALAPLPDDSAGMPLVDYMERIPTSL